MTVEVVLRVWLKSVDLVTGTAYLTLRNKMGYSDRLLAIRRADVSSFAVTCENPEATAAAVKRMIATRSEFYNRNKHNHLLEWWWGDRAPESQGTPLDQLLADLARDVSQSRRPEESQEFDGKRKPERVILGDIPIFRTEVLVEDRESFPKLALAQRLESELGATVVTVSTLGTYWYLGLRAGSESEAAALTEEIVVSKSRDRGLLMNPNAETFAICTVEPLLEA